MEISKITYETTQYLMNTQLADYGYLHKLLIAEAAPSYDDEAEFVEPFSGNVIAPFSTPCRDGTPIYNEAAKVMRVKFPYIKLNDIVDVCSTLEPYVVIGGQVQRKSLSAQDDISKLNLAALARLVQHKNSIGLAKEKMAFDFFANGTGDYSSSYSNGQILDFGRDQILKNVTLANANKWNYVSGTGAVGSILNSLQVANDLLSEFGFELKHVVANSRTMRFLKMHPEILEMKKNCCDKNTQNSVKNIPSPYFFGASSFEIENVTYHTYNAGYKSLDLSTGTPKNTPVKKFMPDGVAIFIGADAMEDIPVRLYHGKLKDAEAIRSGNAQQQILTRMYQTRGVEEVISISAPMVAGNGNCAFMTNVLM
jgi:Phage major capsid protein E